jgi:uncharacterized protein YegL
MSSLVNEVNDKKLINFETNTLYKSYNSYNDDKFKKIIMSISCTGIKIDDETINKIESNNTFYIVLDTSGSMSGNPIDICKKTIIFIINNLKNNDKICLITFNSKVYETIELTNINNENKNNLIEKINKIECTNTTNLSGGLFKCFEILKNQEKNENIDKYSINNIILLTDGVMNEGITNDDEFEYTLKKKIKELSYKPSIYTFGLNNNINSQLLTKISNNGQFQNIEKEDDIPKLIGGCIGGLKSCIGKNIELKLKLNENIKILKIYDSKKNLEEIKKGIYKINVGDCFSEEKKNIIIELDISNVNRENIDKYEVMEIVSSYTDLINKEDDNSLFKSYIYFKDEDEEYNQDVLKNFIRVLYCEYFNAPEENNINHYITKIEKFKEECNDKDFVSKLIDDLNNEKERKENNEEISHNQLSTVQSYSSQRFGNFNNSHSINYSQMSQDTVYYNSSNNNYPQINAQIYDINDDDNDDNLPGFNDNINSQYYDDDDDDDDDDDNDNSLKRISSLQTLTQNPKKKSRR